MFTLRYFEVSGFLEVRGLEPFVYCVLNMHNSVLFTGREAI